MNQATLSLWGGLKTIGGTCLVIAEKGYRAILDFGIPMGPVDEFYGGRLQPRRLLREYLALGIAPRLEGVYRRDLLAGAGTALAPGPDAREAAGVSRTALFISHLHLDHYGLIDTVAPGVPIYMHQESARMLAVLREYGETYGGPARPVLGHGYGEAIQVGPIRVTPLQVDHDIPGACGYLIETSSGAVVYSGDLRWHGYHGAAMEAFVAAARDAAPRALVIEGTRATSAGREESEAQVPAQVAELAAAAPGLALITLYPRNIERVAAVARGIQAAGRTLALSPTVARLFARMGGSLRDVAIYLPTEAAEQVAGGSAPGWLQETLAAARTAGAGVVDAATVRQAQDRFLLQLDLENLAELLALQPAPGSVFIHSNGEPLGKFQAGWDAFRRWLDRFDLKLESARASGHAPAPDLERVITGISPEVVVPVHSFTPDQIPAAGRPVLLPEYGRAYPLDRLMG